MDYSFGVTSPLRNSAKTKQSVVRRATGLVNIYFALTRLTVGNHKNTIRMMMVFVYVCVCVYQIIAGRYIINVCAELYSVMCALFCEREHIHLHPLT